MASADLRLCEPRYVSLPNIMKAKKKAIEEIPLRNVAELAEIKPVIRIRAVTDVPRRKPGRMLDSVEALFEALRSDVRIF